MSEYKLSDEKATEALDVLDAALVALKRKCAAAMEQGNNREFFGIASVAQHLIMALQGNKQGVMALDHDLGVLREFIDALGDAAPRIVQEVREGGLFNRLGHAVFG